MRKKYASVFPINQQIIDSTFILNKFGRNVIARNKFFKNKNCNKISIITDIKGIPLSVISNSGNVHDLTFIDQHIKDMEKLNNKDELTILLADKGYVSKIKKESLIHKSYDLVYPPKKNMKEPFKINKELYKKRIYIEHMFQKLKQFRRISSRYDCFIHTFDAFVYLSCSFIVYRGLNK